MKFEFDDTLVAIARSDELRRLVGQFVTDEGLGERFIANPSAVLNDVGSTLQPDEIAKLAQALLAVRNMNSSDLERIRELVAGADKVIK